MANILDWMDNYESQFLVVAIFECRSEELFTNVVDDMLLLVIIILDKNTNDDTMWCWNVEDIISKLVLIWVEQW